MPLTRIVLEVLANHVVVLVMSLTTILHEVLATDDTSQG